MRPRRRGCYEDVRDVVGRDRPDVLCLLTRFGVVDLGGTVATRREQLSVV